MQNAKSLRINMAENMEKFGGETMDYDDYAKKQSITRFESRKIGSIEWRDLIGMVKSIFPEVYKKETRLLQETSGYDLEYFLPGFLYEGRELPEEAKQALSALRKFFYQASAEQMFESAEREYETAMEDGDFDTACSVAFYLGEKWINQAARKKFESLFQQMQNTSTPEDQSRLALLAFDAAFSRGGRWAMVSQEEWKIVLKNILTNKLFSPGKIFDSVVKLMRYGHIDLKGEEWAMELFHPLAREAVRKRLKSGNREYALVLAGIFSRQGLLTPQEDSDLLAKIEKLKSQN